MDTNSSIEDIKARHRYLGKLKMDARKAMKSGKNAISDYKGQKALLDAKINERLAFIESQHRIFESMRDEQRALVANLSPEEKEIVRKETWIAE